jgi:sigma-E factor negative regulatory protein RseC
MNLECKTRQGRTAANPLGLPLNPGQTEETEIPPRVLAVQAVSALLPPVLGFIAGFFITALVFPGSGDPARSAGGALLMLLFALAFYRYRRK